MSRSNPLELRAHEVTEVLSVEHGEREITITHVDGRYQIGSPGPATQIRLKPEHARWLIEQLVEAVDAITSRNLSSPCPSNEKPTSSS